LNFAFEVLSQVMEYPAQVVWYEGNLDVTWPELELGNAHIYPEVWTTEYGACDT
jgi:hypothetical protein